MPSPSNKEPVDFRHIGEQSAEILNAFTTRHAHDLEGATAITRAFLDLAEKMVANPERLVKAQLDLYQSYLGLWAHMAERMMGKEAEPHTAPEKGDRRFSHEHWDENLVFDYIKQSYLLTSRWLMDTIHGTEGMDAKTKEKVNFYTRQFVDALSPTNFPLTNPEVLQKTVETRGENLVKGLQNILDDLERGNGRLKISMTDYKAFEVGKNLAVTKGDVVYRNRMFELIQYTPKKPKTYERPLLISPPWINKFYILDLQPENSFVRYAVEECGLTVFMISWKNPDETYRDISFEDYMKDGLLEAIKQVKAITKSADVNAIGYCIGGTLLAATLAVLAKKKDTSIHSATFFTTLIDFTEAGELGVFIDEEQVATLEKRMAAKGYLEGAEMAQTFSMLRANDLIWSFVVNNYLLGNDPFPFDLLYWNDDPTRMPAKMHSYYLRNMYMENNLVKKNKLSLLGEKVDIGEINLPLYMVSAINDHITPWTSCFAPLHKMKSKDIRFILGRAGHVAGVACPPSNKKASYWAGAIKPTDANPEKWLEKAEQTPSSWWGDWKAWIHARSGKKIPAPKTPGDAKHKPLCKAPGTYVLEKS